MKFIGIYNFTAFDGIGITNITHGIDEYVIYIDIMVEVYYTQKTHKRKVYYNTKGEAYFICRNHRIYLHDILKT